MYLYVFYCLGFVNQISTDMLDKKVLEQRDPHLEEEEEEDIRISDTREEHWKDIYEDNDKERSKVHDMRREFHMKYKEELINREFSETVTHPKEGNIVQTCVEDNITRGREDYR